MEDFFNEYIEANKFLTVIWDWKNNSEKTLFDGSKEEAVVDWNIVNKQRDIIISRSVSIFRVTLCEIL